MQKEYLLTMYECSLFLLKNKDFILNFIKNDFSKDGKIVTHVIDENKIQFSLLSDDYSFIFHTLPQLKQSKVFIIINRDDIQIGDLCNLFVSNMQCIKYSLTEDF